MLSVALCTVAVSLMVTLLAVLAEDRRRVLLLLRSLRARAADNLAGVTTGTGGSVLTGVMAAVTVTEATAGVIVAAVASMAAAGATAVAVLGVCVPLVMAEAGLTRVGMGAAGETALAVLIGCMVNTVELAGGDGEVDMRAVAPMVVAGDMLRAGVRCRAPVGVCCCTLDVKLE